MVDITTENPPSLSQTLPVTGTIGNYQLTKKLGVGFSAKVKLAHNADGQQFALKIFNL